MRIQHNVFQEQSLKQKQKKPLFLNSLNHKSCQWICTIIRCQRFKM